MNLHVSTLGSILVVHVTLVTCTVAPSQICYEAKTCIHNAKEKCGVDSKSTYRRFFDTCDILEYNCLYGTDFEKTDMGKCAKVPPIPDDKKRDRLKHLSMEGHKRRKREMEDGVKRVANEWWCWEGSRCSLRPYRSLKSVCGWESQSQRRFKFPNECAMAKENCSTRRVLMFALYIATIQSRKERGDNDSDEKKFRYFNCAKARGCSRPRYGRRKLLPRVSTVSYQACGYDEDKLMLVPFNERCDLYKANCQGQGVFFEVAVSVCAMRDSYFKSHGNETFDWIHLREEVTEPSLNPEYRGNNPWRMRVKLVSTKTTK